MSNKSEVRWSYLACMVDSFSMFIIHKWTLWLIKAMAVHLPLVGR